MPVLVVDAIFLAFLAAQATAMFGRHGYLQQTTGPTYAHQGFGQLPVATVLTLTVVAWAARKARPAADVTSPWARCAR